MKRSRFTEEQIIGILKEHGASISVADLCRSAVLLGFFMMEARGRYDRGPEIPNQTTMVHDRQTLTTS